MESNFNSRDFEQFVKQNADQYRMFPSEKVWKGIHNTLHTRGRWYGIGLSFLLLTIGTVTWVMMVSSPGKSQHTPVNQITPANNSEIKSNIERKATILTPSNRGPFTSNAAEVKRNPAPAIIPFVIKNNFRDELSMISGEGETSETFPDNKYMSGIVPSIIPGIQSFDIIIDDNSDFELNRNNVGSSEIKSTETKDIYPLSIESVVNSIEISARKKKLSWQVYFTPTISYRRLAENKAFLNSSQSNNNPYSYAALYNVNSAVTHKPDMGFELGFSVGYPVSSHFKIIGGLQFNVSKYDIRAYTHPTELATIALRSDNGGRSAVSTPTNYRNFDGYRTDWLHNLYLSASAPFGAELKLIGDNKNYLGIRGTIQPTYILGDRAYMISTDYKNYAEVPQLIRRWNIGTSFETFIGYSTGKINWKIGPQVRYQLLSSFQKRYPVKEHIFDFGLKVGVMLNQ